MSAHKQDKQTILSIKHIEHNKTKTCNRQEDKTTEEEIEKLNIIIQGGGKKKTKQQATSKTLFQIIVFRSTERTKAATQ